MLKKYIGKSRVENRDWLLNVWLRDGPPVCFLQGFSGVGKTDLARDVRELAEQQKAVDGRPKWQQAVINEIADRATPSVLESLMELSVTLSRQGLPEMEQVLFEEKTPNLAYALEKALQKPVVIILDEAERFFRDDSAAPLPDMLDILNFLRNRQNLPGRLLLLSDRMVEEARWSEWIPKRTLAKLELDEAVETLDTKLSETGVTVEIPLERKREVVRDLDFNPRAIEALVAALRYDTLDEIIGSNPGLWAVHDRDISRDFLKALERDLLERTMRHLSEMHLRRLRRLAVHRRSFKREAVEKLCGTKEEASELRSILISRYLLNFYKGALSLNPIVREISLGHLREESTEFKQAHSGAADYHLRHFKAKQIVGAQSLLGESFAELRYHLVKADRADELGVIGQRFTEHLKQQISSVSPVPENPEELDERIGVLTAVLGNGGAKGLEYHLARCLQSRSQAGDIRKAIVHAQRATSSEAPEPWYLWANLKRQADGTDAAIAVIHQGIRELSNAEPNPILYSLGAKIQAEANRNEEAVALFKAGIKVVAPDKNLFELYQHCADLLSKIGKIEGKDGAVELLDEGIKVIPPDKGLVSLYEALADTHCRRGAIDAALDVLEDGIIRIPIPFGRRSLELHFINLCRAIGNYHRISAIAAKSPPEGLARPQKLFAEVCTIFDSFKLSDALSCVMNARSEFTEHLELASMEAMIRLASSDPQGALRTLNGIPHREYRKRLPILWLETFLHLRLDNLAAASESMSLFIGKATDPKLLLSEAHLLEIWDQKSVPTEETRYVCELFPVLPPAVTGLDKVIRRIPFGPPVLPASPAPEPERQIRAPVPASETSLPEVYVSYAWGEDSTEGGRQREDLVDQLCRAVQGSGRAIGRDKDRMRGGDSIERFAQEISKAKRIVAVISAKSLHSEFCMAHELFRAFRRCDYQRAEFQEKVIALITDDAKPILQDRLTISALVEEWQEKARKLRAALEKVDPTGRKSPDDWNFLDMVEEMCPRLLAMLGALKDIVMKRGFEEITKDNFQEVIDRLPPASGT